MPWNAHNTIKNRGKKTVSDFIQFTGAYTKNTTATHNVFTITGTSSATISIGIDVSMDYVVIGKGGNSPAPGINKMSGAGGGGGFISGSLRLISNPSQTLNFTFSGSTTFSGSFGTMTAGAGADGVTQGFNGNNGVAGTLLSGSSGGGGSGSGGSPTGDYISYRGNASYQTGGSGAIGGFAASSTIATVNGTYSGAGGGAGGAASTGTATYGGPGVTIPSTLTALYSVFGITEYCKGGSGAYYQGGFGSGQSPNTYGSGAGGTASYNTVSNVITNGISGAIMISLPITIPIKP